MAAVLRHGFPTGALQRCHSLNNDITGRQDPLQTGTLANIGQYGKHCAWILCNKSNQVFVHRWRLFPNQSHVWIPSSLYLQLSKQYAV